ncbi:hypothetical protein EON83_12070 [bacterium]|nr:MAG: hypothetical protein EON83_12070 [bacterium]
MNHIHIGPMELYGCKEALARLEPFIDGELPRDERRRVSFHLVICRNCAPLFRFESRLDGTVRQSLNESEVGAPPELHAKVQRALQQARLADQSPPTE